MSTDRFIDEGKDSWRRLEELLSMLDRSPLGRLNRHEVRELGNIYRRTASDLAIARAESRNPRLVNYLNSLVIRAHGRIYRPETRAGRRIAEFFAFEFPRTVRKNFSFIAIAFSIFWIFGIIGFTGAWRDRDFASLAGVSPSMQAVVDRRVHWWDRLNGQNQIGSSAIMTNNVQVTFYAFAAGALLGLGTVYVLLYNGVSIGALLALVYRAGYGNDLVTFMIGHGVIELSCIFICGGAGLLIGAAMLMPGDLSRADALKSRGREAVKLVVGCVPLLIVAGTIEGFISPAHIAPAIKFTIGAVTGVGLYSYLSLAGRKDSYSHNESGTI